MAKKHSNRELQNMSVEELQSLKNDLLPQGGKPTPLPPKKKYPEHETRIWGGTEVLPRCGSTNDCNGAPDCCPYPFMTQVFTGTVCGGTLIHDEWVLTAAHCVEYITIACANTCADDCCGENDHHVICSGGNCGKVMIGAHNWMAELDGIWWYDYETITIAEIIVHPNFPLDLYDDNHPYDIALLRLSTPSTFTPIPLVTPFDASNCQGLCCNTLTEQNANVCTISFGACIGDPYFCSSGFDYTQDIKLLGWGGTEETGEFGGNCSYPNSCPLMELDTIYHPGECLNVMDWFSDYDDDVHMCVGQEGEGSCYGDSGGPAIMYNEQTQQNELVGVASSGYGFYWSCGDPRSIYTRVEAYLNWIESYVPPIETGCVDLRCTCSDNGCTPGGHWNDIDGSDYDCDWYAGGSACEMWGHYGENCGLTANEACCVCGGGEDASSWTPTTHEEMEEVIDYLEYIWPILYGGDEYGGWYDYECEGLCLIKYGKHCSSYQCTPFTATVSGENDTPGTYYGGQTFYSEQGTFHRDCDDGVNNEFLWGHQCCCIGDGHECLGDSPCFWMDDDTGWCAGDPQHPLCGHNYCNCMCDRYDCMGECDGMAVEDCAGDCGGSAMVDECGVCNGDGSSCTECVLGDLNGDVGAWEVGWNVLDIVILANCILAQDCGPNPNNMEGPFIDFGCAGDMNQDGGWNVLDIVILANCILANNCGGDHINGHPEWDKDEWRYNPPETMSAEEHTRIIQEIVGVGHNLGISTPDGSDHKGFRFITTSNSEDDQYLNDIKSILDSKVTPHIINGGRTTSPKPVGRTTVIKASPPPPIQGGRDSFLEDYVLPGFETCSEIQQGVCAVNSPGDPMWEFYNCDQCVGVGEDGEYDEGDLAILQYIYDNACNNLSNISFEEWVSQKTTWWNNGRLAGANLQYNSGGGKLFLCGDNALPENIGDLTEISYLDIGLHNNITRLPESIGNLFHYSIYELADRNGGGANADATNFEECRNAYNNVRFWPHPDYDWQTIKDYGQMGCTYNNLHLDGNNNLGLSGTIPDSITNWSHINVIYWGIGGNLSAAEFELPDVGYGWTHLWAIPPGAGGPWHHNHGPTACQFIANYSSIDFMNNYDPFFWEHIFGDNEDPYSQYDAWYGPEDCAEYWGSFTGY